MRTRTSSVWCGVALAACLVEAGETRAEGAGKAIDNRWVGTWTLAYSATASSCPDVKVGESITAKLVISVSGGDLQISEQTPTGRMNMKWHGDANNMVLSGRDHESTLVMELGLKWTGHRVLSMTAKDADGPFACAVLYDVTARAR